MNVRLALIAAMIVGLISASPGFADSVTFAGSTIAIKNITIQSIQGGKLAYLDPRGQRQMRPLEDIHVLGFEGLPDLDEAEKLIGKREYDGGLRLLLKAFLAADSNLKKLWIHSRLARVHDLRKEYVQAAGHAAAAMRLSDDPFWRNLEPVSAVNEPDFAAVKEAYQHLLAAGTTAKGAELSNSIVRMLKVIQPMHDRMAKSYKGPTIVSGSTVSGIAKSAIVGDGLEAPAAQPATRPAAVESKSVAGAGAGQSAVDVPAPRPASAPPPAIKPSELAAASDPQSSEAIDLLLGAGNFSKALELCRRIEKQPGERDLAHFLHQYGRALHGSKQPRDAAVMFTRCAVLYADSPDAPLSLIECAVIYRDELHDVDAAKRLLQRAIDLGQTLDQPAIVDQARKALQSLPAVPAATAPAKSP